MKIILCHSILKKELRPLIKYFSKGDIKKYVEKVKNGLGVDLKGAIMPGTKLVNVYMTGKAGAGRMIVLFYVSKEHYLPIVIRLKKDKIIGDNLAKSNQDLQVLLAKNLDLVMEDLQKGDFEEL